MRHPLILEELEGRTLPSVVFTPDRPIFRENPVVPASFRLNSQVEDGPRSAESFISRAKEFAKFLQEFRAADGGHGSPSGQGMPFLEFFRHWEQAAFAERESVRTAVNSLLKEMKDSMEEKGEPEATPRPRVGSERAESGTGAGIERKPLTTGPLAFSQASFRPDLPFPSFSPMDQPNGTEEVVLGGLLAEAVLLDGWQNGVPLPRPELVNAAGQDLTVIAAYLVDSPTTRDPSESVLAIGPEPLSPSGETSFRTGSQLVPEHGGEGGLTDFITGYQGLRSHESDRFTAVPTTAPANGTTFKPRQPIAEAATRESGTVEDTAAPRDVGTAAEVRNGEQDEVGPNDADPFDVLDDLDGAE